MKLLFDQNLSRFLVASLAYDFPGSGHVVDVGLEQATDLEIWELAKVRDYVIVTKDSDFSDLAALLGIPPKVVWLRIGNSSTSVVRELILKNNAIILNFAEHQEAAVLELRVGRH